MRIDVIVVCGIAAAAGAAGGAIAQTATQMILGSWTCSSDTPYGRIVSQMIYNTDGTMDAVSTITIPPNRGRGETVALVETSSSWVLLEGDLLQEEVTRAVVTSAKRDGKDISATLRRQMAKSMVRAFDPEKVELSAAGMVRLDPKTGSRRDCTR
jgi:hypothetical protein